MYEQWWQENCQQQSPEFWLMWLVKYSSGYYNHGVSGNHTSGCYRMCVTQCVNSHFHTSGCFLVSLAISSTTLSVATGCRSLYTFLAIRSTWLFCLLQGVSSSKSLAFSFAIRLVVKNHRHHLALVKFVLTKTCVKLW